MPSRPGTANVFYEEQYFPFLNYLVSALSIQPHHCSATAATENRPIDGHGRIPLAFFCFVLQWQGGSSLTSPAHSCFTSLQRRRGAPLSLQYLSVLGFSIFAESTSVNILFSSVDAGNTVTCNSLTTQPHFSSSAEQTLSMHPLGLLKDDAHLRESI